MLGWVAAGLVAGACVFCVLSLIALWRYRRQPGGQSSEPVTILKPLRGIDLGLEENLRSFFEQDYPRFQIVLAVQDESDPAAGLCRRLIAEYPGVDVRLVLTGAPPEGWNNAKCWQLYRAWPELAHDLIVMADSDIRVAPGFLRRLESALDVATCPYRAIAGDSFWSQTEAAGMNTDFFSGLLVARMLEGVRFAVGPTMFVRRGVVESIGGWPELSNYLAEDFVIGQRAAEKGYRVGLSREIVEHRIGAEPLGKNFAHRLRWHRSTRRSRPAGYTGQLFTLPVPLALILVLIAPAWWPLAAAAAALRLAVAVAHLVVLKAPLAIHLVLVQDLLAFVFWVAGFFGNTVEWRGRRFLLHRDGRFTRMSE